MAKKNVNQKAYKMLQLYAKDIYNYTRFNEKCKKNGKVQTPYEIDVKYKDKDGNEKLSPLFRASMGDNLDLYHLEDIMREENGKESRHDDEPLKYAIKTVKLTSANNIDKYQDIVSSFISVSFDGASHEYEKAFTDYDNNWKTFVKNGIDIKPKFEDFNNSDSVIINDGRVVAVRTNFEIKEEKDLTKFGFKVVPMYDETKKAYKYTQYESDLFVLKAYSESHDYNYFEDKLVDGVYIENNEIIAVKTNYKVTKENVIVSDSDYFEFNKRSKKYYFKNTTSNEKDVYINLGPSFIEYETNKPEIYVKRGLRMRYDELIKKLNDSVYIENGEVFAVKTCTTIENVNELVSESKYFKYKDDKKCYDIRQHSATDVNSYELRKDIYENGFKIRIFNHNVKYIRYKRSASNARSGNCIFINEKYYNAMKEWTYLGEEFAKDKKANEEMPVELEAYKSLSLSTLIDTIKIDPYSILILKDEELKFSEKCVSVKIKDKSLTAEEKDVDIKNTIWDGEGLLDESVFEANGYKDKGMLLLRNRYFKCCAFNTKLQAWFKANNIVDISQLNGYVYRCGNHPDDKPRKVSIHDIKLVITESSLKFIKFRERDNEANNRYIINYWKNRVGDTFGVVKTDKPTKYFNGKVTRTSYQFLNTLGMTEKEVEDLSLQTREYLKYIKNSPEVLKYHLGCQLNIDESDEELDENNDYLDNQKTTGFLNYKRRLVYELLCLNNDFSKARILSDIKTDIISDFKDDFKKGKILVPGTFSTLFGNGYELLHSTIKPEYLFLDKDYNIKDLDNLKLKKGEIMCKRFNKNDELCCVRFPHITMGNVYIAKNKYVDEYDEWFHLTPEIACVNAIGENIQNRLNGMDYDGDTMMITNYKPIVDAANNYYHDFKVPVYEKQDGDIGIDKVDQKKLYDIDYLISNNAVGPITNLSQWLNSILWDMYNSNKSDGFDMKLYYKICKLAILCGMEIDKAKRNYKVDSKVVMDSIIGEIEDNYKNKPKFMGKISQFKNKNLNIDMDNYAEYNTSMGYIDRFKFPDVKNENQVWGKTDLTEDIFFNRDEVTSESGTYKKNKDVLIEQLTDLVTKLNDIKNGDKKKIISKTYEALDEYCDNAIKNKLVTHPYATYLFLKENIDDRLKDKLYLVLLYVLYKTPAKNKSCNNMLQQLFEKKDKQQKLVENPNGDIKLFGNKFKIE